MRSYIDNSFMLEEDSWILSILRRKEATHAFLILEGLDVNGGREVFRFDLGYKEINGIHDEKYYQINERALNDEESLRWLLAQADAKNFAFQSFRIEGDNAEKRKNDFLNEVRQDMCDCRDRSLIYVRYGNKNSALGGFFGNGVASVSGQSTQQASVVANLSSSKSNSIDALLQQGHSCLSWAVEKMKHTFPNYNENVLGKFFISVPGLELPENKGSCMIL